jgi:hypothetical protein
MCPNKLDVLPLQYPPTVIVGWPKITQIINKKGGRMPERHSWQCWKYLVLLMSRRVFSLLGSLWFTPIFFIDFKVL